MIGQDINRIKNINLELARYKGLHEYRPKIGDFVVWHGWVTHWFGIVNVVDEANDKVNLIRENLPKLLLTVIPADYMKHSFIIPISKIRGSRGGEFAVLQNNIWYIDE